MEKWNFITRHNQEKNPNNNKNEHLEQIWHTCNVLLETANQVSDQINYYMPDGCHQNIILSTHDKHS